MTTSPLFCSAAEGCLCDCSVADVCLSCCCCCRASCWERKQLIAGCSGVLSVFCTSCPFACCSLLAVATAMKVGHGAKEMVRCREALVKHTTCLDLTFKHKTVSSQPYGHLWVSQAGACWMQQVPAWWLMVYSSLVVVGCWVSPHHCHLLMSRCCGWGYCCGVLLPRQLQQLHHLHPALQHVSFQIVITAGHGDINKLGQAGVRVL